MDLPVWQALAQELKDEPFTILAVALDEAQAARPWIEAARPGYPCLIDREHRVADLYNLVNVPQAIWIDESGRIVRPPETAGSADTLRWIDRQTGAMPPDVIAQRERTKRGYLQAVADWVRHGAASRNALAEPAAKAALELPSDTIALAHAHFRLGRYLHRIGQEDAARAHLQRASELHPQSWAMFRQSLDKDARGLAVGPEFWARVDALGDQPYYPQPKVE